MIGLLAHILGTFIQRIIMALVIFKMTLKIQVILKDYCRTKKIISGIYIMLYPKNNFLLFLRELEFCRNIINLGCNKKWFKLFSIIN